MTLMEVAVSLGIIIVISAALVLSLAGWRNRAGLDSATKQITTLLREAQSRSMTRASGVAWGVHFDNTSTSVPFYALFSTSYATSTALKRTRLPSGVMFSTSSVPAGASLDITFAELTGMPSASTTIILKLSGSGGGGMVSSTIIVNTSSGLISY